MVGIPLHLDVTPDPTWRCAIVGRLHFHTAIQMDRTGAVLVIAKRLDGQRLQSRTLFGEHSRNLPLSCAVNARIGPALFPVIQVSLCLLKTLKTLPLQRGILCVTDAAL